MSAGTGSNPPALCGGGLPQNQTPSDSSALLETFQKHIDDLRKLISCGICMKPLYEPFTLACGHTFCYSCLTQWFVSHRRKKSCPDCRTAVKAEPAPSYLLRNIIHLFISRPELLEHGESIEEHLANQRAESEKLEADKRNTNPSTGGLFQGCFKKTIPTGVPIYDLEDGVERCPECAWELEEGECLQCGFTVDMISDSEFDSERQRSVGMTEDEDSEIESVFRDEDYRAWPDDLLHELGHNLGRDLWESESSFFLGYDEFSQTHSSGTDEDSDEMDSFIDDDDVEQATVVGDNDYLADGSFRSARMSPYYHPDSVHETSSVAGPDIVTDRMVIELTTSDSASESESESDSESESGSDSESESDSDSDDEPIRAPGRTSLPRRRSGTREYSRSAQPYILDSFNNRRSRRERSGSAIHDAIPLDDDSDSPYRPTRARRSSSGRQSRDQQRGHRNF
ncbi:hypothetical protein VTO42DRAFT_3886 [Malbranchea cinnamomea]